uniref:Pentatricopeptide repeat-containing protein n=1 Tax=Salix viminalis TaxID=40686 RepID=A0A6N2N270_SALVM
MADALIAFDKIYDAGIVPNRVTMVNALGACAGFRAMEVGLKAFRSMEEKNVYASNALIQGLNFAVSGREAVLVVQQNGARRVWGRSCHFGYRG